MIMHIVDEKGNGIGMTDAKREIERDTIISIKKYDGRFVVSGFGDDAIIARRLPEGANEQAYLKHLGKRLLSKENNN